MQRIITTEKEVGQTPLEALELARIKHGISADVPMAYAGRLDPMASGTLLILIGDECKEQTKYHALDKRYDCEVIFGLSSDSGDVLGRLTTANTVVHPTKQELRKITKKLTGPAALQYPVFSSKTVEGKPLHTWAVEGRLDEIQIPVKESTIHQLSITNVRKMNGAKVFALANQKIESIPPVTDPRKALGNDFRRSDVRKDWRDFYMTHDSAQYTIASFTCTASSGTYMRSLAEEIARQAGTVGLALSIHRNRIGVYKKIPVLGGFWTKKY